MITALIDGDIFAYRVAAAAEEVISWPNGKITFHADLPEAINTLDRTLEEYVDRLAAEKTFVALSAPRNFRFDVLPTYKHNRRETRKPILLRALKEHLTDKWDAKTKPKLEADDVLGIWATMPKMKGKKVIVTIDKDLKQIPGWYWSPMHSETPVKVSTEDADYYHMMQTLTGDTTDGYKGCPGIGPARATKIIGDDGKRSPSFLWKWRWLRIVDAYKAKGLNEEDALVQARVARICRFTDYNFDKQEPILWQPPH